MRLLTVCISLVCLNGCFYGAQTKEELYENYGYLEERCSEIGYEDMYEILSENMSRCIADEFETMVMAGNMFIPSSSSTTIKKEYGSDQSTLSAYVAGGPGHYMYTTVVDLTKTEECKSKLVIHGMSSLNKKDLKLIDWWLAGNRSCDPE